MPTYETIAVIDIGKTNAKLVLIDGHGGQQIDVRSVANTIRSDGPYPHADVDRLWAFILDGLAAFQARYGVGAISITTHGATGAVLAGGDLAMPVLDYEFDGPDLSRTDYLAVRPDYAKTFSPNLPNGLNLGAQVFWQSRRFAPDFAKVTAILAYPQYWAWRLTGLLASEVTSLGCHTDLWAPAKGTFSSLVDTMGWRDLMPPLRSAKSVLGPIRPELAGQLGLAAGTPVACGIHDSNASLVPYLDARVTPFTVISTGTWTICMTVGGVLDGLDADRDSLANVDALGRAVPTARFMGGREFDLITAGSVSEPTRSDVASVLDGQHMVLPSFVPGVGPFPKASGHWSPGSGELGSGERTAAASLYLALVTDAALALCGRGLEIIVEGPLARNGLYCAALARLRGVPVVASADATGTSLGAAMLLGPLANTGPQQDPVAPLAMAAFDAYLSTWKAAARREFVGHGDR